VSRAARPAGTSPLGFVRGSEQLEPVLAGVAGAGQQDRRAGHGRGIAGVVLHPGQVGVGQRGQDALGARALQGDQGVVGGAVRDRGVLPPGPLGQRLAHGRGVGGVRDHEELAGGHPVDDQVVDDPAVRGADHGVTGPAGRQRGRLPDQGVVQRVGGVRAGDRDLAHVRQVEQAGRRAYRVVLCRLAAVPQRHQPPGEAGQRRSEALVHAGQRRAPQRRRVGHRHSMARAAPLANTWSGPNAPTRVRGEAAAASARSGWAQLIGAGSGRSACGRPAPSSAVRPPSRSRRGSRRPRGGSRPRGCRAFRYRRSQLRPRDTAE
jgi:hypothetical protein